MIRSSTIWRSLAIAAALAASAAADTARFAPSRDAYVGTLGANASAPDVLNGQGNATLSKLPAGTLLGRDAVRMQIDAGPKATEFWLRADVSLADDVQRLSFWAYSRGIAWSETRAVFQDPEGNVNAYTAQAVGDSPWTLYHLPVRALGKPLFAVGEKTTGDGRWHFRGLTLRYQPFAKGGITLGEMLTSTQAQPAGMPTDSWSFRDIDETLVHQAAYSGFRFGYEATTLPVGVPLGLLTSPARQAVSMAWQLRTQGGAIVDAGEHALAKSESFDPAASDFVLPTLPAANYWLRVKLRGAGGELLNDYEASYLVHRSTAGAATTQRSVESTSFDAFWPGEARATVDVDAANPNPILVPMRGTQAGDRVGWTWLDSTGLAVGNGEAAADATLSVPPPSATLFGPQRYQLQLQLTRGGVVLDRRVAEVYANSVAPAFTAGTKAADRRFVLKETDMRSIRVDQQKAGNDLIANAAANHSDVFLTFYWDEVEPRKGFVQFVPMDQRIGTAAKAGVGVIPTLAVHLDRLPRWLWYPVMLDQGLQSRHYNSSFTRKPSPASREIRDALAETAKQVVHRYKDSPAIVGWNFTQGVESFFSDASRNGFVVDFSRTAAQAFGRQLQASGWTLDAVAAELKRPLSTWDDLTPPMPQFTGELDVRPLWLEWERFKQQVPRDNFESLLKAVRTEDAHRPIFVYAGMGAGDLTTYTAPFKQYEGTICFGGGDAAISPFLESLALNAGVDFDAESAAVPPFQPQLLTTIFNKLSHGATRGGTNIMWGRFFSVDDKEKVEGSRAASRWVDVIDRIGPSVPVWSDVAVGMGSRSIINRTRSFMWIDWMNLSEQSYRFSDMISDTITNSAQVGYVTDNTPLEQMRKFPAIVFLESPLLSDEAANRLNAYVRGGGKLLLQGETGRYDEKGVEKWTLRSLLGAAAEGKVVTVGEGRVRWNATATDWRKPHTLKQLAGDFGYRQPTSVDRADVRHALRKASDGESRFLVLFRKTWPTGNPKLEQVGNKAEPVKASIASLPAGTRWSLTNVVDGSSLGEKTAAELSEGIELSMKPADMIIVRLDPK